MTDFKNLLILLIVILLTGALLAGLFVFIILGAWAVFKLLILLLYIISI